MFNKNNFCHIASNNRNEKKAGVFVYKTTDDLATVLTSGYFNDKIVDINLHDLIIHEWHDQADRTKVQRNILCVIERTLDNVGTTVIKSKWEGDIETAIADLQTYVDSTFVRKDGTSIMSAPLKFLAGSMRGAVGPYLNGVSFWKMDSQGNITNIANLTDSQFVPVTTNSIDLGRTANAWKDAYVARVITAIINNGHDIAVPVTNSADTLALKSEVDLAANSGRMITAQGVWYAKMYAATVVPAADDDTNYADFSQTDGQGNPIIVIYTRTSGAWVQSETITPPAEYDGYVPITSKIWDIPEQAGQQGGRILWNHQSKEFTPYPQIISFENINVTGTSTVAMPQNPGADQIVNKNYVDSEIQQAITANSDFDLFDTKWRDATTNNTKWALSDGNWKTNTNAYQHLVDEYTALKQNYAYIQSDVAISGSYYFYRREDLDEPGEAHPYAWEATENGGATVYCDSTYPQLQDNIYTGPTSSATVGGVMIQARPSTTNFAWPSYETIAGTTITYYLAADGHKICLPDQETNANSIYTATGIAWYYILDTANQQFKLPRTQHAFVGLRDIVGAYVSPGLPDHNHNIQVAIDESAGLGYQKYTPGSGTTLTTTDASASNPIYGNSTTVQPPATQMYLYFYVGA